MTKREMFTSVPAVASIGIMALVSLAASLETHPVAMLMIVAIGVALTMIAIDTGGHSMLMLSAIFLLSAIALTIARLEFEGPGPWVVAGVVSLAYADAVRLCFAERRHGVVEPEVYRGVLVSIGIVVGGSAVTAAVVGGLVGASANASWLLVPLALGLATVGLVVMAVVLSRSPGQFDKRRWKPGERLMAPPRAATDDPSLQNSTPLAPPPPTAPH